MDKKISYLSRNFNDYKNALIEFSKTYYPDLATSFNDASVGSWLIDLNAAIADELSYHIDRVFQETNINSANKDTSIFALARNNGVKIPGPKASMAEVKFTCNLPLQNNSGTAREPDWRYAPLIKKGTKLTSASQTFELVEDVDFAKQFDNNGVSDRTIVPLRDSNSVIVAYRVTKLGIVVAGETRIYKKTISSTDIKPFMEILIPIENVMSIESVLVKEGSVFQTNPTMGEFYMNEETMPDKYPTTKRFFEVDSLIQQERWGECNEAPVIYKSGDDCQVACITKGEWKPVRHKFLAEYTDRGYIKIIFGSGLETVDPIDIQGASDFSKYQITKTMLSDSLGVLPEPETSVFILYRVGGGKASNVAKGAINSISYLNAEISNEAMAGDPNFAANVAAIKNSLTVENTTPSVSGKDMPSVEELRYIIKYNNSGLNRCVTVKDYVGRVLMMPAKYGTPFRVSGTEDNNKIMLYVLGVDSERHLDTKLPLTLVNNINNYLSNYRTINDFVEIKSGRIINLSIEADVFIDKYYDKTSVVKDIIDKIKDYFDIEKLQMGDDIFVGDLEKEVSKIEGVINLIDLRVYNEFGIAKYSPVRTMQETTTLSDCDQNGEERNERLQIDLEASDSMLISDGDCMFEIKYPDNDIRIRVKER